MALDGIFLNLVKSEIEEKLLCSRVDKIHQPSKEEIIISFRTREGIQKLVISTSASSARVGLTEAEVENPKSPPMFCMLLRKHLGSGKLTDVRQDGFERILFFDFDATNEMGDYVSLTLAVEIMGRRSNLILIGSNGRVIDSIKRVSEDVSSVRPVLPGMVYSLPPKEDKLLITELDKNTFKASLEQNSSKLLSKALISCLEGISPVFAREASFFSLRKTDEKPAGELTEDEFSRLFFYLSKTADEVRNKNNTFTVIKDRDGALKDFCFVSISQYGNLMLTKPFQSACELLDYFYSEKDLSSRIKQKAADLFKLLLNLTERISRRISAQKLEFDECSKRDELKLCGDLIMANIWQLEKGQTKAVLDNFFVDGNPKIEVLLDKRLTPSQNAQKYYSEYRKADTAEKMLTGLISSGEEELAYIDSVFDALTRASTENEINELREELAMQGYLKMPKQKGSKQKPLPPLKFVSSDGYTILVGRNNVQNDKLTLKDAEKTDIWLHVHNITGSHVIICANGTTPPDKTIEEACVIAAFHSKAKNSAQVPVDYVQVKYVKKPSGAKPGKVIFTNNQTAYVTPDAELVNALKEK